jgi:hypothetical protein
MTNTKDRVSQKSERTTNSALANGRIPPLLTAAMVCGLVLFISAITWMNLAPRGPMPISVPPTAKTPESQWLRQKAKQCGGDINKLSETDRAKVNSMTHNMGATVMQALNQQTE